MISPLGQRQIFQTANVEAVRQAHETAEQIQRENMRMKAAEDRLAQDQNSVHLIPESESIRTEERHKNRNQNESGEESGSGQGNQEKATDEEGNPAGAADSRFDFLA